MNREWNDIQFYELRTDDMENRAEEVIYSISEIEKQSKEVRAWPLTEALKTRIKEFQDTKPLIQDLQHPAMRERHWKELRHELKEEFREKESDFNYEKLMSL
jgi:dynein heavy chain